MSVLTIDVNLCQEKCFFLLLALVDGVQCVVEVWEKVFHLESGVKNVGAWPKMESREMDVYGCSKNADECKNASC